MLIALGVLAVAAAVLWLFVFRTPPVPPVEKNAKETGWVLYHYRSGKTLRDKEGNALRIPAEEAKALAKDENGRIEYPAGSGNFIWMRQRPGSGIKVIAPQP
ncbi:MAG: hypothetical protein JXO22_09020 [Phycisphaerae bacterium]|nr:hypothetical protein [Phycisphaerae bacterium]